MDVLYQSELLHYQYIIGYSPLILSISYTDDTITEEQLHSDSHCISSLLLQI